MVETVFVGDDTYMPESVQEHQRSELESIVTNQRALSVRQNEVLMDLLESEKFPFDQLKDGTVTYEFEV